MERSVPAFAGTKTMPINGIATKLKGHIEDG
jgi:hypothetical protein